MDPLIPILITGAVALLGLIIAKESKVSEFRQAWIDALRLEVAELLASIHTSLLIISNDDGTGFKDRHELTTESRSALAKSLLDANTALFTIRLRLNSTEPNSIRILTILRDIEILSNDNDALVNAIVSGKSNELETNLVDQARVVLSAEWVRVKAGEPYFRWARRLAAVLAIILIVLVVKQSIIPNTAFKAANFANSKASSTAIAPLAKP